MQQQQKPKYLFSETRRMTQLYELSSKIVSHHKSAMFNVPLWLTIVICLLV